MKNEMEFRVEKFAPLRVAQCRVKAENPETKAFCKLIEWAKTMDSPASENIRFFGFNDPCPAKGQTVYTYEAWMTVGNEVLGTEDIKILDFPGGLYAVSRTSLPRIGEAWDELAAAVRASRYDIGQGPALEEAITHPGKTPFELAIMDICLPIKSLS